MTAEPFAVHPALPALSECSFYHTMDLPGYGLIEGEWDFRKTAGTYLGGVNFAGKRVLDVGTTDGFLCFYAEQQGAREVVGVDLSWPRKLLLHLAANIFRWPVVEFLPNPRAKRPRETWWAIPPPTVKRWLGVLGFDVQRTLYHRQRHRRRWHWLYTVVAHRAQPA
jgi:hypothetical protein